MIRKLDYQFALYYLHDIRKTGKTNIRSIHAKRDHSLTLQRRFSQPYRFKSLRAIRIHVEFLCHDVLNYELDRHIFFDKVAKVVQTGNTKRFLDLNQECFISFRQDKWQKNLN